MGNRNFHTFIGVDIFCKQAVQVDYRACFAEIESQIRDRRNPFNGFRRDLHASFTVTAKMGSWTDIELWSVKLGCLRV